MESDEDHLPSYDESQSQSTRKSNYVGNTVVVLMILGLIVVIVLLAAL